MSDVLALTFGESILVVIVLAVYAAVIWMILDILRRPDLSGGERRWGRSRSGSPLVPR